jgi:hypothetical protein
MIGATYASPFPGWIESLSPVGSLFMYTGIGLIKFIPGDPNFVVDVVPADFVVNQILASVYHVRKKKTYPHKKNISKSEPCAHKVNR